MKTELQRFWLLRRIAVNDCWDWLGSKSKGYGKFGIKREGRAKMVLVRAHRWAYENFIGAIPKGTEIHHVCNNPSCVNPHHLTPVTHRKNVLLGRSICAVNAKKKLCIRGHALNAQRYCPTCRKQRAKAKRKNNTRSKIFVKMYSRMTKQQRQARIAKAQEARRKNQKP